MPSAERILEITTATAHRAIGIAAAWHVIALIAIVALALGWRPSRRRAAALLAAPFLSVGIVSVAGSNPFNGIVFCAAAVTLAVLARKDSPAPIAASSRAMSAVGSALAAVGWVYPHFLADLHPAVYLVAAPLGVVPCATLYFVIGAALALGIGTRGWRATLAALGMIYGVIGISVLGVALDAGLVAGALALAITMAEPARRPAHPSTVWGRRDSRLP